MYSLCFSFIIGYSYAVNILGNVLHGGIFLYNLCILETCFEICKGMLFLSVVIDALKRVAHILKKKSLDLGLKKCSKVLMCVYVVGFSMFIYYFESHYIQNNETFFYFKPNSKVYENRELKRIADFANSLLYCLGLIVSFEIYYALKKQNILFVASSLIFIGLNIAKLCLDELYLYYWIQFIELMGLYFLLWGQSSITKKEQFILMIYD